MKVKEGDILFFREDKKVILILDDAKKAYCLVDGIDRIAQGRTCFLVNKGEHYSIHPPMKFSSEEFFNAILEKLDEH